jgi:hypothetical protein
MAVIRPATALTRRNELKVTHRLPIECFQAFMKPLTEASAEKVVREPTTGFLKPTRTTAALNHWEYEIKKGWAFDALFHLEDFDPEPPKPKQPKPSVEPVVVQAGEEDVYEVEEIREPLLADAVALDGDGSREQYVGVRQSGCNPNPVQDQVARQLHLMVS